MFESHFCCSSGKYSTFPELLPKKNMPLMLLRALMLKSTLATTLSTRTSLLNPLVMLILGLLLRGNPLPLQVTGGPSVQPPIFKLAGLTVIPPACKSLITSGMLLAQSPVGRNTQFPAVGIETMDGEVMPANELPTLYRCPS